MKYTGYLASDYGASPYQLNALPESLTNFILAISAAGLAWALRGGACISFIEEDYLKKQHDFDIIANSNHIDTWLNITKPMTAHSYLNNFNIHNRDTLTLFIETGYGTYSQVDIRFENQIPIYKVFSLRSNQGNLINIPVVDLYYALYERAKKIQLLYKLGNKEKLEKHINYFNRIIFLISEKKPKRMFSKSKLSFCLSDLLMLKIPNIDTVRLKEQIINKKQRL